MSLNVKAVRERIASALKTHVKGWPMEGNKLVPNPVPVSPPVGYQKQPSMVEIVREMVRSEKLRQEVMAADLETFEEADDFDVGDDFDPSSPYEEVFDPYSEEINRRLQRAEFDATVRERLAEARKQVEVKHGRSFEADKGRSGDSAERSGRSGSERKGKSEPERDAEHESDD